MNMANQALKLDREKPCIFKSITVIDLRCSKFSSRFTISRPLSSKRSVPTLSLECRNGDLLMLTTRICIWWPVRMVPEKRYSRGISLPYQSSRISAPKLLLRISRLTILQAWALKAGLFSLTLSTLTTRGLMRHCGRGCKFHPMTLWLMVLADLK